MLIVQMFTLSIWVCFIVSFISLSSKDSHSDAFKIIYSKTEILKIEQQIYIKNTENTIQREQSYPEKRIEPYYILCTIFDYMIGYIAPFIFIIIL